MSKDLFPRTSKRRAVVVGAAVAEGIDDFGRPRAWTRLLAAEGGGVATLIERLIAERPAVNVLPPG